MKLQTLFITALLILTLAGCSAATETPSSISGTESESPVAVSTASEKTPPLTEKRTLTISMSGMLAKNETPIYKYIKDYEQLHPDVTITLDYTICGLYFDSLAFGVGNNKTYESQLRKISKEIAGNASADIFAVSDYTYLQYLNKNGDLADIGAMMEVDTSFNANDYFGNIFDALTFNGELNYFPLGFSIDYVMINKQFLNQMENPVGSAVNFLDMANLYERLREVYTIDTLPSFWDSYAFYTLYRCATDLNSMDIANRSVTLNTPETTSLIEKRAIFQPADPNIISTSSDTYFYPVEQSFLFLFKWNKLSANPYGAKATSTIFTGYEGVPTDYSIWLPYNNAAFTNPVPFADFDGNISFYSNSVFAIHERSENKDLAWDFLKFCASEKEADRETGELSSLYSVDEFPINKNNLKKLGVYELGIVYDKNEKDGIYLDGQRENIISEAAKRLETMALAGSRLSQSYTLETYGALVADSFRFAQPTPASVGVNITFPYDPKEIQKELMKAETNLLEIMNR